MKKGAENEEILIDADTGEEIEPEEGEVTNATLKSKMKDLRAELRKALQERDENLAGWQRSKADLVNFRKNVAEDATRNELRAKGSLVRTLMPVLDSFESAMADKTWQNVEKEWREGVERIANQMHTALEQEGLITFGKVGDTFDPTLHECMSIVPTDEKKKDHTLHQVLQSGYKVGTELVRPAKVIVAQVESA